jgi:hypothetical protein
METMGIPEAPVVTDPKDNHEREQDEDLQSDAAPLSSISELFLFGQDPKTKWCLIVGFACSIVTGSVVPAMAFVFANSFQDLGASTGDGDFLKNIRKISYTLMILG